MTKIDVFKLKHGIDNDSVRQSNIQFSLPSPNKNPIL